MVSILGFDTCSYVALLNPAVFDTAVTSNH
jgi:hypothetical protein